jgi:hypothetical protein
MSYLCWLCLSLPLGVCRRAHVLFVWAVLVFTYEPSYKHLEVKTNTTNTNKTSALLQTPRGKDKQNQHK